MLRISGESHVRKARSKRTSLHVTNVDSRSILLRQAGGEGGGGEAGGEYGHALVPSADRYFHGLLTGPSNRFVYTKWPSMKANIPS